MRKPLAMLLAPAVALLAADCGSPSTKSATAAASTPAAPSTSSTPATGAVQISTSLQGRTLLHVAPDKAKKVTCLGACASVWPPLALSDGRSEC